MIASVASTAAILALAAGTIAILVLSVGSVAEGLIRAQRHQTPPGAVGEIRVACAGQRSPGESTNVPGLLFIATPERLELRSMVRVMGGEARIVEKTGRHAIRVTQKSRSTTAAVVDDVSGFQAWIYSAPRAREVSALLAQWGWLVSPPEEARAPQSVDMTTNERTTVLTSFHRRAMLVLFPLALALLVGGLILSLNGSPGWIVCGIGYVVLAAGWNIYYFMFWRPEFNRRFPLRNS